MVIFLHLDSREAVMEEDKENEMENSNDEKGEMLQLQWVKEREKGLTRVCRGSKKL